MISSESGQIKRDRDNCPRTERIGTKSATQIALVLNNWQAVLVTLPSRIPRKIADALAPLQRISKKTQAC